MKDEEKPADAAQEREEPTVEARRRRLRFFYDRVSKLYREIPRVIDKKLPDYFNNRASEFIHDGFYSLCRYLESPEEPEVSWEDPVLELQYPVPLDWELWETSGDVAVSLLYRGLDHGDVIEEARRDPKAFAHRITGNYLEWADYLLLSRMTHEVGYVKRGDEYEPHLPAEEQKKLDELPKEEAFARLDELFEPFSMGFLDVDEEDLDEEGNVVPERVEARLRGREPFGPAAKVSGDVDGKPFTADALLAVYPLVVDEDEHRAYFPVVVGLAFDGEGGDPTTWSEADRRQFWEELLGSLREQIGAPPRPKQGGETKAETGTFPAPVAAMKKTFPLAFGRTVMDSSSLEFLRQLHKVRLPATRWASLPSWDELQEEEVRRLREEEGEAAFQDFRRKTGDPEERRALLRRVYKDGGKTEEVRLTTEGEKRLQIRQGMGKGFRYFDRQAGKEYLVRLFQVGKGYLRVGLSWYGMAGPWVEEWNRELQKQTAAIAAGKTPRSLFEDLDQESRDRVDRLVRRAQILADGRRLMEAVLGQVGRQGRNPVRIPAVTLRTLLKLTTDKDWKARVEGGLGALRACEFGVRSFDMETVKGYGNFLAEWWYRGAGPGDHGEGDYFLHVTPGFLGCLTVFESGKFRLSSGREVTGYNFGKTLTKEEKKALGWGRGGKAVSTFSGFDAGRVFYSAAQGLTSEQENLVAFLEAELTRRKDPAASPRKAAQVKRTAKDANEPRLYGRKDCPLLQDGKLYHGALGHFRRSPETGRSLYGQRTRSSATGGGHTEGLLSVLGYSLPPGAAHKERKKVVRQALEDLKAVVVDYLGGVVAARHGGKWLSLEEASRLPEKDLGRKTKWSLFLPETWREDQKRTWEARMEERAARGEEPHAWTVTEDPVEAERARELLLEDVEGTTPLRHRLRAARLERGLSLAHVGDLFGVSKVAVSKWETGTEPDEEDGVVRGRPIPAELEAAVLRWVETGEAPTAEELASRKTRRAGVRRET